MENTYILPFCIYHYINPAKNIYTGFIIPAFLTKPEKGEKYISCRNELEIYDYKDTFFAFTTVIRPVPLGTKIFQLVNSKTFPYNLIDIQTVFDPYQKVDKTGVYFITYSKPVPHTTPLYFHRLGKNIFPSFDKNPPSKDKNWRENTISPIYVMTKNTVGPDIDKILFHCVNTRCIPWKKKDKNIWKSGKPVSFSDCFVKCNILNFDENEESGDKIYRENMKKLLYTYLVTLLLALVVVLILIFVLYKKLW